MSTSANPDEEPDLFLERLAGRGEKGKPPHPLREALLAEAAANAELERLAREPLSDDERALMERVRHRLEAANLLGASTATPNSGQRHSQKGTAKTTGRSKVGLGSLALPSPRWLLAGGVGALAFLWWLAQAPRMGEPPGMEIHLRGEGEVTLIDPNPALRAQAVAQELQRLGWRAAAIQANEQLWWVTIPKRDDASDAQLAAAARALNLKPSTPLPDRVRVQP
jgi:hypothetical protein